MTNFEKDFRSDEDALTAVHIIIAAKKGGLSNRDILQITWFKDLFSEEFLERTKDNYLKLAEIKLKNIARDFRFSAKESIDLEWLFAKDYFDLQKKTKK